MTSDAAQGTRAVPLPAQARPATRIATRQQMHDRLVRLCEAVLWQMARGRMH